MSNKMSVYSKESGSYYYKDYSGNIIFMSDEISLLYDFEDHVLLKHGSPSSVQKYFEKYREKIKEDNPTLERLRVATSDKWKVSELNRILDTSGYIRLLSSEPERFEEK